MKRIATSKQRVFDFIRRYIDSNQEAPTMAEIGRQFQLNSSASVFNILVDLEKDGMIKRTPNISRGIEIVPQVTQGIGWQDR
jgi:repressor LexA